MPIAKKLPSGSYRCQVFAGYEYVNGKKKRLYESFTAYTKAEAEAMAASWACAKKVRPDNISVREAVEQYIASRENVSSPSTIRGYLSCVGRFDRIADKKIRSLTESDVQLWISTLAAKLSPKSVKNTYGLFTASMGFFGQDHFRVKLPAKIRPEYHIPTDQELQVLLQKCDETLWLAVMLARYYSLREGEICALRSEDLNKNILTIRRTIVHTKDNRWVIKERPKTDASYRYLVISDPVLSVLKKRNGEIIGCNPNALGNRFRRAVKQSGLPPFRFHDLRHAFASSAALVGIPDFYTARMGGWNPNSGVLKTIYQNIQNEEYLAQMQLLNEVMQHEMQHGAGQTLKKAPKTGAFYMPAVGLEPDSD